MYDTTLCNKTHLIAVCFTLSPVFMLIMIGEEGWDSSLLILDVELGAGWAVFVLEREGAPNDINLMSILA